MPAEEPADGGALVTGEASEPGQERAGEREVGQVEVLTAAPGQYLEPAGLALSLQLANQFRLPDAGIAGQQDDPRLACECRVEPGLEPSELLTTTDERGRAHGRAA